MADDLEEELYCPICADVFEDPLMLPCTHSFCRSCLGERIQKGLVNRKAASISFDCPVCREEVTLGDKQLDGLPSNRLLRRMIERHNANLAKENEVAQARDHNHCAEHQKELGAFCAVCRETVCIDCIVGDHRGHAVESIEDIYFKRRKTLGRKKSDLDDEIKTLEAAKSEELEYLEEITAHCKKKAESIEVQFDEFIGLIKQSKESILSELAGRQQQEMDVVAQTLESIEEKEVQITELITSLDKQMKMDKITLLKDTKQELLRSGSLETDRSQCVRSPRTRCFLECTLEVDSVALEQAINNAHLVWEPEVDVYSPKHLADRFNQLYDKEWKSAYLESTAKNKDETVAVLLSIIMDAFRQAQCCCETHLEGVAYHMLQPEIDVSLGEYSIRGFNNIQPEAPESASFCCMKEGLRKVRAQHTSAFLDNIVFVTHHELTQLHTSLGSGNQRQISVYANKCFELGFLLQIQDPPLYIALPSDQDPTLVTDKEQFKYMKRRGRKSKILAWPPMYLYRDGPLLVKGVVFVPG